MSLIKCSECGKEISNKAISCPNCGAPVSVKNNTNKSGFMKVCKYCKTSMPKEATICPNCKKKQTSNDWIVVLILIVFIFWGLKSCGNNKNDKEPQQTNEEITVHRTEESKIEEKKETETNSVQDLILDDEMNEFLSDEYLFITNEDLSTYCPNMKDVKVYVVITIDDIKDDAIQSTLSDGFMMSNFKVSENFEKYKSALKNDDMVAIMGTVSGYTDYKFMGKTVDLKDCKVFAVGEDAINYKKDKSDEGLSDYLIVTEEVANSKNDVSEEDYKALCEKLDYKDILRNPSNYKGKYCKLSGKVDQIIEGFFGTYTIYISDSNDNKWECSYSYKDGESHLLEDDNVTIYGKCNGTSNSTTLLGKQVTLPSIDVEYIN